MHRSVLPGEPWPEPSVLGDAVDYPAGVLVFRQGAAVRTLYYIEAGQVRLDTARPGGRDVTLGIRSAGWLLGASPAVLDGRHWASGVVLESCRLRALSVERFHRLTEMSLAVCRWVHRALATDLRAHVALVAALGGDAASRLAWYLTDLAQTRSVRLGDGSLLLTDSPTQEAIGAAIAVSREHACRLLHKLEKDGALRRDKGRYVIPRGSSLLDFIDHRTA